MCSKSSLYLEQSVGQQQRLIMLPRMQQAIEMLQVPVVEIASLIEQEMERNPLLEYEDLEDLSEDREREEPEESLEKEMLFDEHNLSILQQLDEEFCEHFSKTENYFTKSASEEERGVGFLESVACRKVSLIDHMMAQARESFSLQNEVEMAETLIGYLDESGFLSTPMEEIALLHQYQLCQLQKIAETLQTFDPAGIAAYDLRHSLLLQLRRKGRESSLAYKIVERCYRDLIRNKITVISRDLKVAPAKICQSIDEMAKLEFHPAAIFSADLSLFITPDITLCQEGEDLVVSANEEPIPHFRVNKKYLHLLKDPSLSLEAASFIKQKITSARWLMRIIDQRSTTLFRIAQRLLIHQRGFFLSSIGELVPLTMRVVAEELELHESTVARAVANKYVECPRGLFPLRFFFSNALTTAEGEISSTTVRDLLKELIDQESKDHPLSDEVIAHIIAKRGIKCARRTISKYRHELGFGTAQQRRQYT